MRAITLTAALILAGSLSGCGGASPRVTAAASHSGTTIELPGKKGFFEIQTEAGKAAARSTRSRKKIESAIVVHFYQPDGTTEMSPAPTDVSVKIGTAADSQVVALTPRSGGGFVSATGVYPESFRGELSAKIDGESLRVPFAIR